MSAPTPAAADADDDEGSRGSTATPRLSNTAPPPGGDPPQMSLTSSSQGGGGDDDAWTRGEFRPVVSDGSLENVRAQAHPAVAAASTAASAAAAAVGGGHSHGEREQVRGWYAGQQGQHQQQHQYAPGSKGHHPSSGGYPMSQGYNQGHNGYTQAPPPPSHPQQYRAPPHHGAALQFTPPGHPQHRLNNALVPRSMIRARRRERIRTMMEVVIVAALFLAFVTAFENVTGQKAWGGGGGGGGGGGAGVGGGGRQVQAQGQAKSQDGDKLVGDGAGGAGASGGAVVDASSLLDRFPPAVLPSDAPHASSSADRTSRRLHSPRGDAAYFLDVPFSGGDVLKEIFDSCYLDLIKAEVSDLGLLFRGGDRVVEILRGRRRMDDGGGGAGGVGGGGGIDVEAAMAAAAQGQGDPTSEGGRRLEEAAAAAPDDAAAAASMPDVVYSSSAYASLQAASNAINPPDPSSSSHGDEPSQSDKPHRPIRLFTLLRHPLARSYAEYRYLTSSDAVWEPSHFPALAGMDLQRAANTGYMVDDYLTRLLTDTPRNTVLTQEHVDKAAEVLRRKFLVGLEGELGESWFRIRNAFDWPAGGGTEENGASAGAGNGMGSRECSENVVWRDERRGADLKREKDRRRKIAQQQQAKMGPAGVAAAGVAAVPNIIPPPPAAGTPPTSSAFSEEELAEPTDAELRVLLSLNRYDLQLYERARAIFDEQAGLFYGPEDLEEEEDVEME